MYLTAWGNFSIEDSARVATGTAQVSLEGRVSITLNSSAANVLATTGQIQLIGGHMMLDSAAIATTGTVTIQRYCIGQKIHLGGADTSTAFGLTSAELDQFDAATLKIGTVGPGLMNFGDLMPTDKHDVKFLSSTGIVVTGAVNVNHGTVDGGQLRLRSAGHPVCKRCCCFF